MLFLHESRIVFLCSTKTASSSVESALLPFSGISLTASPVLKHMTYRKFLKQIAPLIERGHNLKRDDYTVICIMREPTSWVHSWYRYRSRDALKHAKGSRRHNYSGDVSYSEFVRSYCSSEPRPYARIGDQMALFNDVDGSVGVDRVFPYESLGQFTDYLRDKIGTKLEIPSLNISPSAQHSLDADTEKLLHAKLQPSIEFHGRLRPDGSLGQDST